LGLRRILVQRQEEDQVVLAGANSDLVVRRLLKDLVADASQGPNVPVELRIRRDLLPRVTHRGKRLHNVGLGLGLRAPPDDRQHSEFADLELRGRARKLDNILAALDILRTLVDWTQGAALVG